MSVTIPIVSTPDVLGGTPRIEGTRVGVYQVGTLVREQGWSRTTAADEFDLTTAELDAALDYYDTHPEEMAAIGDGHDATAERLRERSRAAE
jgi:uncharacterized protein (DUF433 family)